MRRGGGGVVRFTKRMLAILSLLLVLTLSILVTRIAGVALAHTGLSREAARFQARSAFTGVGFTTSESESVVNHPVRRRILLLLMLLGNAGIVTAVSSLILTFISPSRGDGLPVKLAILVGGVVGLLALAHSGWVDARLSTVIDWALRKYTRLEVKDYSSILHLSSGYRISELHVKKEDWIADRALRECRLRDEGVNVLGIQRRSGKYVGGLTPDTVIHPGDRLVLYGRAAALEELEARRKGVAGDREHEEAVAEEAENINKEKAAD